MNCKYRKFAVFFISISMILFLLFFVRLFTKIVLVNKMQCNSTSLQYIADYTLGDWVNVITEGNWATENNSEAYEYYSNIYSEMLNIPSQLTKKEKTDEEKLMFFSPFFEQIQSKVSVAEDDIEKYTNERYFGAKLIKKIRQCYQKIVIGGMVYARKEDEEFDLLDGYTWKAVNPTEGDFVEERILRIGNYAKENDVNYLVVKIPNRISYSGDVIPIGANEYSNYNMDQEVRALEEQGFDCYDLRKDLYEKGWNAQEGFFKTDPHWTAESGFLTAGLIASYLNEYYGHSFDLSLLDKSNYEEKIYGLNNFENKEQVSILFPEFSNKMVFRNFEGGYEYSGLFEESVFDQGMLDPSFKKSVLDIYSGCRIRNSKLGMMESEFFVNDEVILFDISSMSWYTVSYLALQTKQVYFTTGANAEQMKYLIETLHPDMVISIR